MAFLDGPGPAHSGTVRVGPSAGTVPGSWPKGTGMRIVIWHGYLLGGTGSNVYTRSLAREWSRAGHDVVVVSQEPHPEQYDLGGARHVRPEIGGVLPVFVLDRYDGL